MDNYLKAKLVSLPTTPISAVAATVTVGTTTTGEAGTSAIVENVGTEKHAILNFTIPRGAGGGQGGEWSSITGKPFETLGAGLKVVGNQLQVDTATVVQEDNTKPVTSGAVFMEIGNIEALLAAL